MFNFVVSRQSRHGHAAHSSVLELCQYELTLLGRNEATDR